MHIYDFCSHLRRPVPKLHPFKLSLAPLLGWMEEMDSKAWMCWAGFCLQCPLKLWPLYGWTFKLVWPCFLESIHIASYSYIAFCLCLTAAWGPFHHEQRAAGVFCPGLARANLSDPDLQGLLTQPTMTLGQGVSQESLGCGGPSPQRLFRSSPSLSPLMASPVHPISDSQLQRQHTGLSQASTLDFSNSNLATLPQQAIQSISKQSSPAEPPNTAASQTITLPSPSMPPQASPSQPPASQATPLQVQPAATPPATPLHLQPAANPPATPLQVQPAAIPQQPQPPATPLHLQPAATPPATPLHLQPAATPPATPLHAQPAATPRQPQPQPPATPLQQQPTVTTPPLATPRLESQPTATPTVTTLALATPPLQSQPTVTPTVTTPESQSEATPLQTQPSVMPPTAQPPLQATTSPLGPQPITAAPSEATAEDQASKAAGSSNEQPATENMEGTMYTDGTYWKILGSTSCCKYNSMAGTNWCIL